MEHSQISKQNIDKNQLSVFLRDLSYNVNINLKHIIEDLFIKETNENKNKNNYHKNKKQVIKKKDIIRKEQTEKRKVKQIEDDKKKAEYYINNVSKEPFSPLSCLKTIEGRIHYKLLLFQKLWKQKKHSIKYLIVLYYDLKDLEIDEKIYSGITKRLQKMETQIKDSNIKNYMLDELGDMLSPLNYWDHSEKKLDDWQINVIEHIKHNKSVIVKAPTSSGKSFIAMATGIIHKKVLYVCPAKPVVFQVGSHFMYMGYKVHFLIDGFVNKSYDSKTNIFIGTPKDIETNIQKIGVSFDYTVFDEIHNLNEETDGDMYENIIKLVDSNFLALSATISNVDYLIDFFRKVHPEKDIQYVEYKKRFMNQQKWIWKNESLIQLHPLCAFDKVDSNFLDSPILFTPKDCSNIWESIEEIMDGVIGDVDEYSPDSFFKKECMLTLDDCTEYEIYIKKLLYSWSVTYPKQVKEIIDSFKVEKCNEPNDKKDILLLMKKCKEDKMLPMIMFHKDESVCLELFKSIGELLEKKESQEYPFHYDILESKNDLYKEFEEKKSSFESSCSIMKGSTDSRLEKETKVKQFISKEKQKYIQSMGTYYQQKIKDIDRSEVSDKIKEKQTSNLVREYNEFIDNPDFCSQDIFKKHSDFIFTLDNEPMSGDTIREIRREIYKTAGIKIPYEHIIFQMLKRGIGIYSETMPEEYNWIIQKLLTIRKIGIVISGKILCLGIDLPIRTSVFLGIQNAYFTKDEYLQMSGRAGRRGKDNQGNVIFYGDIDYVSLMQSKLPDLVGSSKPIYQSYRILDKKYFNEKVFDNMIHPEREYKLVENYNELVKNKKLAWELRHCEKSHLFMTEYETIESKLFSCNEFERLNTLIMIIQTYLLPGTNIQHIIKTHKLNSYEDIKSINRCMNILIMLYNNSNYREYFIFMSLCNELFLILHKTLYSYLF